MEPEELESFKRMAQQDNPQVLPACIDALDRALQSTSDEIINVDIQNRAEHRQNIRDLGLVAAATTVSSLEISLIEYIYNTGDIAKFVALGGLVTAGILAVREHFKNKLRRDESRKLAVEFFMLAFFREEAIDRAKNLPIDPIVSED